MATHDIRELLAGHRFFTGLPDGDVGLVAGCGHLEHVAAGTTLFAEGTPAEVFYVLRHGRVALEAHAAGRQPLVIETLSDGDVVGWSWLFPPHRWQFDGRVVQDTSAVVLDGACLRAKCDADPALGYRLMQRFAQLVVERLQATRVQLLDVYGSPTGGGRARG